MPEHPLANYLSDCRSRRGTGALTPETSLYSPLETLLNAAGRRLKPRVRCFMNLKEQGAGLPDGGLFTPDQIAKGADEPPAGQAPSRGVIECKKPKEVVLSIAESEQVSKYWNRYNQVLVTNYWEFLLVGRDAKGKSIRHERYRLAESEADFWKLTTHPEKGAEEQGDRFFEFLLRCLRRPAPLTEPKDVAWFLASYARDARGRVEHSAAHEAMATVRKALEDALGLKVKDAKGEHFFQSTLVQTLFYGVFSAWVLWHRTNPAPGEAFDWEKSGKYLYVPILRKLFREMTDPAQLDAWDNLTEVMGWAADTLNRVDRDAFFAKFKDTEAVQYFYEPFLEAFDPELRKQLGVWYTPPEIVKYMVARVDQTLKTEFKRSDGLADKDVFVLDPCCGTGTYLVETLRVIAATLTENGVGALLAERLKQAATKRVFGFEILPAPFVVAHLQLGLFLQQHGTALDEKKRERAAVYLTNALTGWQPPKGPKERLMFPEMEEERDQADRVKQEVPILVVLGNPPYYSKADRPFVASEEAGLVEPYRKTKNAPKPQGQGLNDLYVRFFRIAERCITERHDQNGIVCYISNYSWLDGLSHTGLRERLLEEFDEILIDSLNGDKYKTGKTTPDGKPDPSVFSTPHNREGIQVGTAVALLLRKPKHTAPAAIGFRDFWGEKKREELLASAEPFQHKKYAAVAAVDALGLAFRPMTADRAYGTWPLIVDLFPASYPGVKTSRDEDLVEFDLVRLRNKITHYLDAKASDDDLLRIVPSLMSDASGFDARTTRATLLGRGIQTDGFVRYAYRPFDNRWVYWEAKTKLLDRSRPELHRLVARGNYFLYTTGRTRKDQVEPAVVTQSLTDLNYMDSGARGIPLFVRTDEQLSLGEIRKEDFVPNLSAKAVEYLKQTSAISDGLFFHCLAILHSIAYRTDNFSGLKTNWPRIPLPNSHKLLLAGGALGRRVAALIDPEVAVDGVTTGKARGELKQLGVATRIGGAQFQGRDFAVTAHWGSAGTGGVAMPGKGRQEPRVFDNYEVAALGAANLERLGPDTFDIYLNDHACWRNVPRRVWEYTLGGYQVLKKWLSYREEALLGRPLSADEIGYFTQVVRRIAALLLMGPELDEHYRQVKADTYEWPKAISSGRLSR